MNSNVCSNEIIGLSVTTGFFLLTTIISIAVSCRVRQKETMVPCPYCSTPLPPEATREHLQTCAEHLIHYHPKRTSQRVLLESFYVDNPRK